MADDDWVQVRQLLQIIKDAFKEGNLYDLHDYFEQQRQRTERFNEIAQLVVGDEDSIANAIITLHRV